MTTDHAPDDSEPARRKWLYGAVGLAAACAGIGLARWESGRKDSSDATTEALWGMRFTTLDGSTLPLKTMAGKPLLINFWATWCPPCVEELPLLDRFFQDHATKGWQVLGLAADQEAPVRSFLQRMPLRFPVALAGLAGIDLSKSLGNLAGSLPFTVVLSSPGGIVQRKMGRLTTEDLRLWSAIS